MTLTTQVTFAKNKSSVVIDSLKTNLIFQTIKNVPKSLNSSSVYLLFCDQSLLFIGLEQDLTTIKLDNANLLVEITTKQDIELLHLKRLLINKALENGLAIKDTSEMAVPTNIENAFLELIQSILLVLEGMGHPIRALEKKKGKPSKARHKWTKEVSEIEFFINTRDSVATVMWVKRNQMLIKKGATMMKEAPLNKDGSVGLSAKVGNQFRSENKDKFKNFVTTEDIILKSVNEVGLFLYFAGTNSWLEMVDKDGKTLNEWTVVE